MSRGITIHVGIPFVGAGCQATETLDGPAGDVVTMIEIAQTHNFEIGPVLFGRHATRDSLFNALDAAAQRLTAGDILLVSYSGHGFQTIGAGEDGEVYDETWCLADSVVLDDELYGAWGSFGPGVRILIVSDSCHSGSILGLNARAPVENASAPDGQQPARQGVDLSIANEWCIPELAHPRLLPRRKSRAAIGASVLLLASCKERQRSADGCPNGLFTEELKNVWAGGAFSGTYAHFIAEVCDRVADRNPDQEPGLFVAGEPNCAFVSQRPFTI
jgi:hypothetical protein